MFDDLMYFFLSSLFLTEHSILAFSIVIPSSVIDSFRSFMTSDSDVSLWNPVITSLTLILVSMCSPGFVTSVFVFFVHVKDFLFHTVTPAIADWSDELPFFHFSHFFIFHVFEFCFDFFHFSFFHFFMFFFFHFFILPSPGPSKNIVFLIKILILRHESGNAPIETSPLPQQHAQDFFAFRVRGNPSLRFMILSLICLYLVSNSSPFIPPNILRDISIVASAPMLFFSIVFFSFITFPWCTRYVPRGIDDLLSTSSDVVAAFWFLSRLILIVFPLIVFINRHASSMVVFSFTSVANTKM